MDWTKRQTGPRVELIGSEKGEEVATLTAVPRLGAAGEGIVGWTIIRLHVAESRRDDADFQKALVPELIAQAKAEGWVTDDDIAAYRLVRDEAGVPVRMEAGSLIVEYPKNDPTIIMGFRANARVEAETVAAAKGIELEPIDPMVSDVLSRPVDEAAIVDESVGGIGRPAARR